MTQPVPLSVLDLVPVASGSTPRDALANTVDLAQRTEAAGYTRYWVAEHHLNPGVAGTSPALVIGFVAGATSRIRVGSGAVLLGHQTPLSVVEQFGLLDAAYPGRIDLGLGRSGFRRTGPGVLPGGAAAPARPRPPRTDAGLVLPPPFSFERLLRSPRVALQGALLQQPNAETPDYGEQVGEILALLDGTYRSADGLAAQVTPGRARRSRCGSSAAAAGRARVAGHFGLPFAANYHVAPAAVLDAVEAYRAAFRPSAVRAAPHVAVSADVVVGETDGHARELATGYGLWVRSIRTGEGAIAFPSPDEARRHAWSSEDRALVQDRLDTQFVGSPGTVADQLEVLARETGADELVITTITHDHRDRVRSYELLAEEWTQRRPRQTGAPAAAVALR